MSKLLMVIAAGMISGVAAHAEYYEPHPIVPNLTEYTVEIESCYEMGNGGPIICFDDAGRKVLLNYVGGELPDPFVPGNNTKNGYDSRK